MLRLNIFYRLKSQFSVTRDVFTVNVSRSETTKLCTADTKVHYFFKAVKTIRSVAALASVLAAMGETSAGSLF